MSTSRPIAYSCYSGISIKQRYIVTTTDGKRNSVLVGITKQRLRVRYPNQYSPVQYLNEATNDLKCLAALVVADLVPVGIFADKLEEEFPKHGLACEILRNWAEIRSIL
jgi:hypothetical protein